MEISMLWLWRGSPGSGEPSDLFGGVCIHLAKAASAFKRVRKPFRSVRFSCPHAETKVQP
jgi:hypothetical protein